MSRFTRSRAAPDWTLQEMLTLVSEVAAVDDECRTAISSHQKWDIVSSHCVALDVARSSYQCRRKWDSLLSEYRTIKDWESRSGADSCWCLESERRVEFGLPASFDRELFGLIDDVLKAQEKGRVGHPGKDFDSRRLVCDSEEEMEDMLVDSMIVDSSVSKKVKHWKGKNITERVHEKARCLQDSAEQIEAILRAELPKEENRSCTAVDLTRLNALETEFTRQQADQLIKAFGSLIGTLGQLNELVKDGGIDTLSAL